MNLKLRKLGEALAVILIFLVASYLFTGFLGLLAALYVSAWVAGWGVGR